MFQSAALGSVDFLTLHGSAVVKGLREKVYRPCPKSWEKLGRGDFYAACNQYILGMQWLSNKGDNAFVRRACANPPATRMQTQGFSSHHCSLCAVIVEVQKAKTAAAGHGPA